MRDNLQTDGDVYSWDLDVGGRLGLGKDKGGIRSRTPSGRKASSGIDKDFYHQDGLVNQ